MASCSSDYLLNQPIRQNMVESIEFSAGVIVALYMEDENNDDYSFT